MKKATVLALILVLVLGSAFAENPYLTDWVSTYNALAGKNGLPGFDAAAFQYMPEEGYFAVMPDEDTTFMLGFADGGNISVCALQALEGDERIAPVLACALAASAENIRFESALELFKKLLNRLGNSKSFEFEVQDGWYLVATSETEEGKTYVMAAFTSASAADSAAEDTMPGNIWDGFEPDEKEPAPKATPKPKEGRYKI